MGEGAGVDGMGSSSARLDALISHIEAAAGVGDWTTALGLFGEHFVALAGDRYVWTRELLARMPEDCPMDPVLRLARAFIVGQRGGALPEVDDAQAPPQVRAAAALIQVITLRTLGRLDDAEQVVQAAGPAIAAMEAVEVTDTVALTRLHFGILRLLRGDLDAALEDFRLANVMALHARSDFVVRNSAGNLALIHAVRGDLAAAERWLTVFDAAEVDPGGFFEPRVRVGGLVARALVALGRLRLDEAEAVLDDLRDIDPIEELWVFVAVARALVALVRGDAMAGLGVLEEAEVSHRGSTSGVGVARWLLTGVRCDLLLAVGQAARARATLAATDDQTDTLAVSRAQVALVTGAIAEAMPLADALAWGPTASVRTRTTAFLIASVARWRHVAAGDEQDSAAGAEAHALLARAVELAEPQGLVQPFALMPRDELRRTAAAGPSAEQIGRLLDTPALAAVGPLLPARLAVVELSERELAVLAELATTRSLDVVAKRLFVSTNTVKTQVRLLYRKLGVHTREEALSVAYREGLLAS